MSDDEDRLELMERRLSEAVEEKVRSRLFKVYGIIGGAILTILGFVGYDGIKDIREIAVEAAKQEALEQVAPVVANAQAVVNSATEQANQTQATLLVARERLDIVDNTLARGESRIADFGQEVADALAKYETLGTAIKETESRLNQTAAEIENQQKRAQDTFAGAGTLSDLATIVDTLTQQVSALNKQVKEIAQIADITTSASGASETELEKVRTGAVQTVPAASATNTVFFQFAGLPREQAQEIVGALRSRGYTVPGEDREDAAANLREVRFFFDEDKPAADKLAADTQATLAELGFADIPIKTNRLVDYRGQKPRRGVLELWLDLAPG